MACELSPPGGGGKRGKTTKVFFPLLTPQTFLRTRLPAVARLKSGGPQGRLVLQENALDGSGVFRSANQALCTEWPRTVMRGGLRKENSGHNSLPKPARRTEPSPRNPRFAARPKGVAAQRKGWGVKRGRETLVSLPLLPSAVGTASPGRRRRPLCTLTPSVKSPSAAHRCIGGNIPSAEGKEKRLRTGVRSLAVFSASAD